MKRIFTLLLFVIFSGAGLKAQMADGSIAPNFITTDLDGNQWELYDLLDQGYWVVIDLSATWCGPCWNYHHSGALTDLYNQYGPDGTNEMRVFMIEGDPSTNLACLYGEDGCNSSTYGDWTEGTPYPIINDDEIAGLYELAYWPTIYHICPSRIVREIPQSGTEEIYAMNADCPIAFGENNAGLIDYDGFEGVFCSAKTFAPVVSLQNLGSTNLTSTNIELYLNGVLESTTEWTGDLTTYAIEDVTLNEITLTEDTQMEIKATSANGAVDEDETNNNIVVEAILSTIKTEDNFVTLELMTDSYPFETYWDIKDENGTVIYFGGNPAVIGAESNAGAYVEGNSLYMFELALPQDNCYEFTIYDSYGDGICCTEGEGFYRLNDANGNRLFEGGDFELIESTPFTLENAAVINDNGALVSYSGEGGPFCGEYAFSPVFQIHNVGANLISAITLEAIQGENVLTTFEWTGLLPSGQISDINMSEVIVSEPGTVNFNIVAINGNPDDYDYNNSVQGEFVKNITKNHVLQLDLQLDSYAYEIYWQFTNSAGEVLASGGNQNVGPNGAGGQVAGTGDPGAYAASTLVSEEIVLPEGVDDCISFLIVDDWGDGLVDGGGGYYSIQNADGEVVAAQDLTSTRFLALDVLIDAQLNTTGLEDLFNESISLFPNPVQNKLNLKLNLNQEVDMQISIVDVLGKEIKIADHNFIRGYNQYSMDVSSLNQGVYFLKLATENEEILRKFTVID